MKLFIRILILLILPLTLEAASVQTSAPEDRLARSDGAGIAELVTYRSRESGGVIRTEFTFRTVESIRSNLPPFFKVSAPGGTHNGTAHADSRLPNLYPQDNYLLFLNIHKGRLGFLDGAAGAMQPETADLEALRAAASGLSDDADLAAFETEPLSVGFSTSPSGLIESGGFRRFTLPDRGDPIPVYADISTRPAGISEAEAITALENALAAWEAVSTVQFSLEGTAVFAQPADTYSSADGLVIRVQMHDNFDDISNASYTLGFGGANYSEDDGNGGTIDGRSFNPITFGYVILDHPKAALSDPVSLEEVLTHEIGHVVGLVHSSESSPEADATRRQAIMYYLAHLDGRGATLNSYDSDTIIQAYPDDTPPYTFDRVFLAVSSPTLTLTHPEVNRVTLAGADLQGTSLSLQQDDATAFNGTFSLSGSVLSYTPLGWYGDSDVEDPENQYSDRFRGRFSDGTNLSPFVEVRVIGFRSDTRPLIAPDGVPDSWMTTYYGSIDGSTAGADTDGDGFDNKTEFLLGTDPTDGNSRLKITDQSPGWLEWTSQRFGVYRIRSSDDLSGWTTERLVNQPVDAGTLTATGLPEANPGEDLFFRIERVD